MSKPIFGMHKNFLVLMKVGKYECLINGLELSHVIGGLVEVVSHIASMKVTKYELFIELSRDWGPCRGCITYCIDESG